MNGERGTAPHAPSDAVDPVATESDDAVITRALRRSSLILCVAGMIVGILVFFDVKTLFPTAPASPVSLAVARPRAYPPMRVPHVPLVDVTRAAGITFTHENGGSTEKLLPEMMGGGCAFFDFDADGDQDLLLQNCRRWDWDSRPTEMPATPTLYRNDGTGHFKDVTAGSGLDVSLFGMGVACGDFDNDGLVDVFLPAVGEDRLFRNLGSGRFVDVTSSARVAGDSDAWGTSAGWFDYDNDGDLDLFVCNYVAWSREYDVGQEFGQTGMGRSYGRPQAFEGSFSSLFRNEGNGTFADVSTAAGIHVRNPATGVPAGKALAVTFHDFDEDGWLDIVVANDFVRNHFFHNRGDGTFEEIAETAGVAYDFDGNARASMGIDTAHFRNDDAVGIAIGNYANWMTALLVSYGDELRFTDEGNTSGLGYDTVRELTFGLFFVDYDLDGRLDFFTANGHVLDDIHRVQTNQSFEQPPVLSWNCGPEQATEFRRVGGGECGPDIEQRTVGRGASFADIDGDGDIDLLVANLIGPPRLFRNDHSLGHHWLRFRLRGTRCNRDAIGAVVEVDLDGCTLRREVMPTRSYLSQVELPVTFGLGDIDRVRSVRIRWPDGSRQEFHDVATDRVYEFVQPLSDVSEATRKTTPPRSGTIETGSGPEAVAGTLPPGSG